MEAKIRAKLEIVKGDGKKKDERKKEEKKKRFTVNHHASDYRTPPHHSLWGMEISNPGVPDLFEAKLLNTKDAGKFFIYYDPGNVVLH